MRFEAHVLSSQIISALLVLPLFSAQTEERTPQKNSGGRSSNLSVLIVASETDKDLCSSRNKSKQIPGIEKEDAARKEFLHDGKQSRATMV